MNQHTSTQASGHEHLRMNHACRRYHDQEYTGENISYIQSLESSLGINWSEYSDGIYIKGSAESWDILQNSLTVEMLDGYSYAWEPGTEDDVVAILDILKDGRKVGYYNVYYSYSVNVDINITGAGIVSYQKSDFYSKINICSLDSIDLNSLTYTVSDQRFESFVEEDDEGDFFLIIRWKESKKEIQRYELYNLTGCYISDVTGSYVQSFNEYPDRVFVCYDAEHEGELNWDDVSFTFINGYTGVVVRSEVEDYDYYLLKMKDSSGNIIMTKGLYWDES